MRILPGCFVVPEFFVDRLVTLANRGAFGLGGVGGEDGLDADLFEGCDDIVFAQTSLFEAVDDGGPESLDGDSPMGGTTGAAELPGDAFFDDIQEFEADGKKLGSFAFVSDGNGIRKSFALLPGDEGAQAFIKWECAREHGGGVGETRVEFAKSFFEITIVLNGVRHSVKE